MLTTLSEVRTSGALNIAGVCATSTQFTRLVNEATSRIMRRGDWSGTVIPIYVCVKRGCVVFPRYVLNVRKMNHCCSVVPIKNNWYEFMPNDSMWRWDSSRYNYESWASFRYTGGPRCAVIGQTQTPVFQDILGEGRLLRAHPRYQNDAGKTLRIFGIDNNGQTLMERDATNTWIPGITLTLAFPYASSTTFVRSIERVLKDETEGPVNLYAYNAADSVLEEIAQYDGAETNPSYSKYQLGNWPQPGCSTFPITALVKLRYVPAKNPDDLVLIDNLDALKDMMQSIKLREAGDIAGASAFEASAIRELNLQLDDEAPLDQIPIRMGELGGTSIGYQKVF